LYFVLEFKDDLFLSIFEDSYSLMVELTSSISGRSALRCDYLFDHWLSENPEAYGG